MTEQEQKAKFKQAIDHTLSGLEGNPCLFQRVAASAEKGAKNMKYHIPKGVLIALIALLCMGTVAVATGALGGTVDWDGRIIGEDVYNDPGPTATPAGMTDDHMAMDLLAIDTISTAADMEMVMVYAPNMHGGYSSSSNGVTRKVGTLEELEALLEDAPELPLPEYIPDGYVFASADVAYSCREDGEYTFLGREELDYGMYAERYRLEDESALLMGYSLVLRDSQEDYHYISINAGMREAYQENMYEFGYTADDTVTAVSVPGWTKALAVNGPKSCYLALLRPMAQKCQYQEFWAAGTELREVGDVMIDIYAPLLDTDTLIRMFAAE